MFSNFIEKIDLWNITVFHNSHFKLIERRKKIPIRCFI